MQNYSWNKMVSSNLNLENQFVLNILNPFNKVHRYFIANSKNINILKKYTNKKGKSFCNFNTRSKDF